MRSFPLVHIAALPLLHTGDCSLRGVHVTDDGGIIIYVEETYDEDGWLAQGALKLDGTWIACVDEEAGANPDIAPLPLPDSIITPRACWNTMRLNYAGPRHRGLREPERLMDILRPISVADKFAVTKRLSLALPPPLLLGVAESYVLSEATVLHPDLFFVCRRLRLAYALETEAHDETGLPYDYDTHIVHAAHFYDRKAGSTAESEPALIDALTALPDVVLRRPMDCLIVDDLLFIADAASEPADVTHSARQPSMIQVWRIEIPDDARRRPSEEEKLYG
ncbi:MAG: hypothetical protein SGI73_13560 [Chloroflexota bacterium]|nr:hypothetical protein [Chloroflexota bacterium]